MSITNRRDLPGPSLDPDALVEISRRSAGRLVDMWPRPDLEAIHQSKRDALRAVMRVNGLPEVDNRVLDSMIAAADTGI